MRSRKVRVAIIGSGKGSNAESIIRHANYEHSLFQVSLVIASKPGIGLIKKAELASIPVFVLDTSLGSMDKSAQICQQVKENTIDVIVLAGYLSRLDDAVIETVNGRVLNIHPSLLPMYGGVGMYGKRVHEAVLAAGETTTGATVHIVTHDYDEGAIVMQASVTIDEGVTAVQLADKVLKLEHEIYPVAIDKCVKLWF